MNTPVTGYVAADQRAVGATLNVSDHYWVIGGSTTDVYASKTNTIVPVTDADYVAWQAQRGYPVPILNEDELATVLRSYGSQLPEWLLSAPSGFIQPAPGAYDADQLKSYSADARWRKEQGGITATAGFPIRTDDRAQAKLTGLYTASQESPAVVTPFHAADNSVQQVDAAGMYQLHVDLLTHINNCFSISADNQAAIDAGTMTTLEQIDAAYAAQITAARRDWLKKK